MLSERLDKQCGPVDVSGTCAGGSERGYGLNSKGACSRDGQERVKVLPAGRTPPLDFFRALFTHLCGSEQKRRPSLWKCNGGPLSVPQSALWPNALMIRPYSTPARALLGAPWQDSALSPGIFAKQWAPWEAANGENPGPG